MAVTRVFTVEAAQITDGAANEVTDADNEDHVIEKIKVIDEDGNLGAASDVTIQVSGNSITDQVIPLSELAQTHGDLPVLTLYWPSNKQLRFSYQNEAGATIKLKFVIYVRDGSGVSDNTAAGEVLSTPLS